MFVEQAVVCSQAGCVPLRDLLAGVRLLLWAVRSVACQSVRSSGMKVLVRLWGLLMNIVVKTV